jgi:hypothetical protein
MFRMKYCILSLNDENEEYVNTRSEMLCATGAEKY